MELTLSYNKKGLSITKALKTIMIPKSSFFKIIRMVKSANELTETDESKIISKPIKIERRRGRKKSNFTYRLISDDSNSKGIIISVPNNIVKNDIKELLSREFICYGYKKVAKYLKKYLGYIINHKKVYGIMKEMSLLLPKIRPVSLDIIRVRNRKITLNKTK